LQALLATLRAWLKSAGWAGWPRRAWGEAPAGNSAAPGFEAIRAGLELATQGIILLDGDAKIVAANSLGRALLHSAAADLPGLDFWDVVPEAVTEDHRSACTQALQDGAPHAFVVHHAFEDQWIEYSLRRHACGVVVNMKDVTDTRQALLLLQGSELSNQSLFDGNPQAMWVFDAGSRHILAINQAAAWFYGMPQHGLAELPIEIFFPDGEGAGWLASLPATDLQQEMRLCMQIKTSGERVLVELACSTVQWLERPAVLVGVVDVGARHFADAQLERLNASLEQRIGECSTELQRSRHELDTFTRALSDDLKAPLHAVNGFATTLAERYAAALDEPGRHYLARIRASTRQSAKLIDDLRMLAHVPGAAMAPGPLDLAPVCRRLIEDLRKREPERHVVLEIAPTLPVFGDRNLLVTAVACLVDNAWKFTVKKEQGWIRVALLPGESPGNSSVLEVADNGVGFDVAYADRLFTAFQRLHSSADFPGGGLGLAIVRRVAERHGGSTWATTTGAGASFFLSLPQEAG